MQTAQKEDDMESISLSSEDNQIQNTSTLHRRIPYTSTSEESVVVATVVSDGVRNSPRYKINPVCNTPCCFLCCFPCWLCAWCCLPNKCFA